jgi:hypothetical protein
MGIAASLSAEEVSREVSKLLVNDPERDRVVSKVIEQGIDGVEALDLTNEDFEGTVPFRFRVASTETRTTICRVQNYWLSQKEAEARTGEEPAEHPTTQRSEHACGHGTGLWG